MEMCGSIAEARRYSSSTSGWSSAFDRTRAITRRCSVMRMPRSAQSFSIRSMAAKIGWTVALWKLSRKVQDQRQRIFSASVRMRIIAASPPHLDEAASGVQGAGGAVALGDFQEHPFGVQDG